MNENKTIILVTGLPGSGKTAASSHIRSKGIPTFLLGDIFREEMRKRGLEFTNVNSERVAVQVRKEHGMDYAARKTGEKIKRLDNMLVCVDGARDMFELRRLASFGKLILVIIDAPEKIRYKRLVNAGGYKRPKSYEEFLWRAKEELKRGMAKIIHTHKYEKYVIRNKSTKYELKRKIDELLENIHKNIKD